jgi:hypothetical protein
MIQFAQRAVDAFFARGLSSITVPVMDGPFMPNQSLEHAPVVFAQSGLDNLVATNDALFCSSGPELLRLKVQGSGFVAESVTRYDSAITCLAAAPDCSFAVGLESGGIVIRGGVFDGLRFGQPASNGLRAPVAALFDGSEKLIVANGSDDSPPSGWRRDLMSLGRTGSVRRFDLTSGQSETLASGLGFPCGLALHKSGQLCVSEAWRHRIAGIDLAGQNRPPVILDHLPGYPSRICPAKDGGYWLSVFAVRNQLVEFILRETRYRRRMLAEVPEEEWMAPALASGMNINEPLQWSAIMQMGVMKPWAAGRSYGLLVYLDADFRPRFSYHSRADGSVHGVTSACEFAGAAQGAGAAGD